MITWLVMGLHTEHEQPELDRYMYNVMYVEYGAQASIELGPVSFTFFFFSQPGGLFAKYHFILQDEGQQVSNGEFNPAC